MRVLKALVSLVVVIVLGFFCFLTLYGFGILCGVAIMLLTTTQIVLGTLVGSIMVVLYLLSKLTP